MPKQLAYLYDNTIQVYFDLGIGTTGDRRQEKMYERMLKFYKGIDNQVQFQFLINSVRKKKRFGGRWLKQTKLKDIEYIKEYFGYSNEKAREALNILTIKQIEHIKETLYKGGRRK